jgi:ribose transport system permease protein
MSDASMVDRGERILPNPEPPVGGDRAARLRTRMQELGILLACALVFIALSVASPAFLTADNLLNVLDQWAPVGIIACAGTLVIIAGGFDLSTGSAVALSGVVAAALAPHVGVSVALMSGALIGLVAGIGNGLITTIGRVNTFMGTLATAMVLRGLTTVVTGGMLVTVADPSFSNLGLGRFLGVSYSAWIWLIFAVCCGVLLQRSIFGRYVVAAGGNAEAARLSGVRVQLIRAVTFGLSGLAAGIAGVILASRSGSAQAATGVGMELTVIAAIVVGGTSILGGRGAIWRTICGVLLLAMIGNGFNILNVDAIYQQIVQGSIILVAVALDSWTRRTA